jgi:predicted glycoside hydrolase/deacetylase ChbG (UPF0249 family)
MKTIIITADDYGMCKEVDQAIRECMKVGVVTTTNVLLNMETTKTASTLRKEFPEVSIGIHWNVTTGKPVSKIDDVKTLVDKDGNFYSLVEFKRRISKGLIDKIELEKELIAQYDIFKTLCGRPDYWNTHENSALCFASFNIFAKAAKKLNINSTRNFQRVYIDIESVPLKRRLEEFVKSRMADIWFGLIVKKDFNMPDGRLFPFKLESKLDTDRLISKLKNSNKKIIEIIIHPATTGDNPLFGNISYERVSEFEFFSRGELRSIFLYNGLQLDNYEVVLNRRH